VIAVGDGAVKHKVPAKAAFGSLNATVKATVGSGSARSFRMKR